MNVYFVNLVLHMFDFWVTHFDKHKKITNLIFETGNGKVTLLRVGRQTHRQ
jgi:hypothetical protein